MISSARRRCTSSSFRKRPNARACRRNGVFIRTPRPAMMLSSTVMPRKSAMFWNVRATPFRAVWCGRMRRRVTPRNVIVPRSGW